MKLTFSQPWGKDEPLASVISTALKLAIPPRYRDGLLIKVLFLTSSEARRVWRYKGNYRLDTLHGLYPSEYAYRAVITLKLPRDFSVVETVHLVGHEAGHHVSYAKTGRFGEVTAEKYAARIVEKWDKAQG